MTHTGGFEGWDTSRWPRRRLGWMTGVATVAMVGIITLGATGISVEAQRSAADGTVFRNRGSAYSRLASGYPPGQAEVERRFQIASVGFRTHSRSIP